MTPPTANPATTKMDTTMAATDPGDMPGLVASLPDTATVEAAFVVGRGGRVGGTVDGRGGRVAGVPRVMRSGRSGRL